MAKTYSQIQDQIAALQRKADAARQKEIDGVVKKINVAIAHYGLKASDLNLGGGGPKKANGPAGGTVYSDGNGRTWSGRGPRPGWLKEALAAGKKLEDFAGQPTKAVKARRTGPTGKVAPKYRDEAGNTWTGRGSQPRWLRVAVATGKSIDSFII